MKYTEALKMFDGDEMKLRHAMRADRQVMYYLRKHLKKGVDMELTEYRQLCIEMHFKRKDERISNWQHVGDVANKLVADMIKIEQEK
jgi:hypothetical protein